MSHLSESQQVSMYYYTAKKGQEQHCRVKAATACQICIAKYKSDSLRNERALDLQLVLTSEDGSQPWRPWRAGRSSDPE